MGLFTDRAPTAKFNKIGDFCTGRIVEISKSHRTEFKRDGSIGDLMYWYNGKPTAGVAVDPQTKEPNRPVEDPVITVDTGEPDEYGNTERRIFVKGKGDLAAIKTACTGAGVRDIEIGGRITKTWISGAGGTSDPRVYGYEYEPPAAQGVAMTEALDLVQRQTHEGLAKKAAKRQAAKDEVPPF